MPTLAAKPDHLKALEAELRRRHRCLVRNLRLEPKDDGIELFGEAATFYAKQLIIRDVLADGAIRIHRNRIAVDQPKS